MNSIFLETLKGIKTKTPPLWMMRQAGRYLPEYRSVRAQAGSFLDLCYNPKLACEVTLQPIRRFEFDAAILFSDILVVPHAMGIDVKFVEGEGPKLEKLPFQSILPQKSITQFLTPVYEAVSLIRENLPKNTPLIGFSGAPWTLMTYIAAGGGKDNQIAALNWLHNDASSFQMNLDILSSAVIEHCNAQIAAGAQIIQLFDSWAHVLKGDDLKTCSILPMQKIVAGIKAKNPTIPVIIFPRGIGIDNLAAFYEIQADGISINQDINFHSVNAQKPKNLILQGNLDQNLLIYTNGLEDAVNDILSANENIPFIFNLGHGILPSTPIENVEKFIKYVRKYV